MKLHYCNILLSYCIFIPIVPCGPGVPPGGCHGTNSEIYHGTGSLGLFGGLHFGAFNLQVFWDDSAWQVHHFVWFGPFFPFQVQYFGEMGWRIAKRIGTRPSALYSTCGSLINLLRFWKLWSSKKRGGPQNFFLLGLRTFYFLRKSRMLATFQIERKKERKMDRYIDHR